MGNFNREDRSRAGGGFRSDRNSGGRDRGEKKQMFQAICAECGKRCEVPFKPSSNKPVYCSNCFSDKNGGGDGRGERRSRGGLNLGGSKQMFDAICDKCHKECQVPFKPSSDKPVYCNDCFGKGDERGKRRDAGVSAPNTANPVSTEGYKKQFEALNTKLDSILALLAKQPTAVKAPEVKKIEVKAAEKVTKKTAVEKKPVAKKKVAEKPVAKKTVAKKSAVKKTVAKKAAAKKPVVKKKTAVKKGPLEKKKVVTKYKSPTKKK